MGRKLKYAPLTERLIGGEEPVEMTFDEIASLVGALPPSARKFAQWWENTSHHAQAKAWLAAGYRVDSVDRDDGRVTFRKASA